MMPTAREWLFSFKTFGAAMLALGIGLSAGLDRPYWAMATVYIASQPLSGATRSKAAYRLMGTLLGAAAAVALVPNLVTAPELLSLALAGWTGLCLTLSLLDRTPRGYVFMLAGYTAAIIGFPGVAAPDAIWDTALARTEEIGLGIVCASVVASVVFPRHVGPVVAERTNAWLRDGRRWALDVLEGRETPERARADCRRLAADAVELGVLAAHLNYDPSVQRQAARAVRVFHGRMLMLLPLLSSISDRLAALRASGGVDAELAVLLAGLARWLRGGAPTSEAAGVRAALSALQAELDGRARWGGVMRAGLLLRLRDLLDLQEDCRALQAHIRDGRPGLPPLRGAHDAEAVSRHRDAGMAVFSGLSAGLAVGSVCAFWIASAWPEGAVAAEMTAVACCFFATQDNPVPAILGFLRWTAVAVVLDAVLLFAVLPMVDGFEMLVLVLAPPFLLFGVLMARPGTAFAGLALAANGATLLSLQETYSADFASFANAAIATVLGMGAAAVLTRLVRSMGAEAGALRLLRANWLDLAEAAERRGRGDRAAFAGLMLDRLGLAAPRLAAMEAGGTVAAGDLLAELRIGLNILDLRRARHVLPAPVAGAVDAVLDGVADVFRSRARAPRRAQPAPPPATLLARVDEALSVVTTGIPPARQQDALLGLGGLRRALFPDAPPGLPPMHPNQVPGERRAA